MCLRRRMSSLLFFSIFIFTGLGIYGLLLRKKGLRSQFTESWTVYCFVMSIVCLVLAYCVSICDSWQQENKRRSRNAAGENTSEGSGVSGNVLPVLPNGRRYGPSVVKSGPLPPLSISTSSLHHPPAGIQSASTSPREFAFASPSPRSASSAGHFVFPPGTYLQSQVVSPSRGSGGRYFLSGGVSSSTRSIASAPAEGPRSPLDNPSNHNSSAHHNGDIGTGNGGSASHPNTSVERTGGGHGQQRSGNAGAFAGSGVGGRTSPRERPVLFVVVPRGSALQLPAMLDVPRSPNSPLDRRCVRRCCSLPRSGHRRARRFYQGGHGGGGSGSHGGPHVGTSGQGGAHSTPPPSPRQVCLVLPSSVHPAQIAALHSRSFRRRRSNSFSGLDAVRHSHRSSDQLEIPGARVGASGASASTGDISLEDDPPSYASLCEDPPPYSEIVRPVSHTASQTSDPEKEVGLSGAHDTATLGAVSRSSEDVPITCGTSAIADHGITVTVQRSSPATTDGDIETTSEMLGANFSSSSTGVPIPDELVTTTTIVDGLHETAA
ncbi:uncharacterized protein LOC111250742 isoform X2 [Varroa destructor]|uniref:Uncharacterized protein n=1 Tax=Varroa destructor TaxID=109461 RepID=A0A7M7K700_VARDE|nr:uncharacterized protein LOC111250742 isoform X2 [Varroa destructor]